MSLQRDIGPASLIKDTSVQAKLRTLGQKIKDTGQRKNSY